MKMPKLPIKSAEENDFLTKWRQKVKHRHTQIAKAKRRHGKRIRRWFRKEIDAQLREGE